MHVSGPMYGRNWSGLQALTQQGLFQGGQGVLSPPLSSWLSLYLICPPPLDLDLPPSPLNSGPSCLLPLKRNPLHSVHAYTVYMLYLVRNTIQTNALVLQLGENTDSLHVHMSLPHMHTDAHYIHVHVHALPHCVNCSGFRGPLCDWCTDPSPAGDGDEPSRVHALPHQAPQSG